MVGVKMVVGQASFMAAIAVSAWLVLQPATAQGFADGFEGEKLSEAWTIENPDQDGYRLEGGSLLIQANAVVTDAEIAGGSLTNLFTVDTDHPEGDWTMSVRFDADFQSVQESIVFGLLDSADKYVLADFHIGGDSNRGWAFNAELRKQSGRSQARFSHAIARLRCNICGKERTFKRFTSTIEMPIDAQIVKTGREYALNLRMGDAGGWKRVATVVLINPPVRPVLFARQRADTDGKSAFRIDHFRVDAAN